MRTLPVSLLLLISLTLSSCTGGEYVNLDEILFQVDTEEIAQYTEEIAQSPSDNIKLNIGWERHFELIENHVNNDEIIEALELAVAALHDLSDDEIQEQIVLLRQLTSIYLNLGEFEIAETFLQQAKFLDHQFSKNKEIDIDTYCYHEYCPLIDNELIIALILSTLTDLYFDEGNDEKAYAARQEALELFADTWGNVSPETAITMILIANIYDRNGEYELAEDLREAAFDIFQNSVYDIVIGLPYVNEPAFIDNTEPDLE